MRLEADELLEIVRQAFEAPYTMAFTVTTAIFSFKIDCTKINAFHCATGLYPY